MGSSQSTKLPKHKTWTGAHIGSKHPSWTMGGYPGHISNFGNQAPVQGFFCHPCIVAFYC